VRENLAITAGFGILAVTAYYPSRLNTSVFALPLGLRWNPVRDASRRPAKPYLAVAFGPVRGRLTGTDSAGNPREVASTTVEGQVGGGIDVHVARSWTLGVNFTQTWMGDVPGVGRNFGGSQVGITAGWLFGAGRGLR
jgi:hypothetical protein